ncbi:ATP-binding cassette domain-containing protein [Bifidobacterium callitrichos]|uniref:ATP-binding cassette domain-containing protein n=1 Tax=Bifidobacterium callitrichos TaxID=762209 RepID=A0A5M9ZA85_9BIFI|nr:ATP-binding cassette domain-containing protein [Bifidobacterium callitrichos]KAA8815429.1 ATP-binding cassette domain-containing protein [Bifidobacterium callitrichos]
MSGKDVKDIRDSEDTEMKAEGAEARNVEDEMTRNTDQTDQTDQINEQPDDKPTPDSPIKADGPDADESATPEVSFSFTFDDDDESADLAALADTAGSNENEASEAVETFDTTESDENRASAGSETSDTAGSDADAGTVPGETSAAATEANARRVNETMALAGDAMANGGHGDPNELRHSESQAESEVDKQVADRVLLKSYPNFSLNHATTTNRKSGRHVLDDTSMAFYAGELYAVRVLPDADDAEQRVTMMEVLGGFQAPTSGSAMAKSANLLELEVGELRGHRLGIVPQRFAVRGDLDAESNVLYAMNASGRTYLKPKPIAAREFLAKVGFGEATSGRKVRDLALVEQRRVAIARAISCESDTLILDEPTKGLSVNDAKAILDLIVSIAHARDPKRAVIIVTSSDEVADRADKVYKLAD